MGVLLQGLHLQSLQEERTLGQSLSLQDTDTDTDISQTDWWQNRQRAKWIETASTKKESDTPPDSTVLTVACTSSRPITVQMPACPHGAGHRSYCVAHLPQHSAEAVCSCATGEVRCVAHNIHSRANSSAGSDESVRQVQ